MKQIKSLFLVIFFVFLAFSPVFMLNNNFYKPIITFTAALFLYFIISIIYTLMKNLVSTCSLHPLEKKLKETIKSIFSKFKKFLRALFNYIFCKKQFSVVRWTRITIAIPIFAISVLVLYEMHNTPEYIPTFYIIQTTPDNNSIFNTLSPYLTLLVPILYFTSLLLDTLEHINQNNNARPIDSIRIFITIILLVSLFLYLIKLPVDYIFYNNDNWLIIYFTLIPALTTILEDLYTNIKEQKKNNRN